VTAGLLGRGTDRATLAGLLRAHAADAGRVLYRLEGGSCVTYGEQLRRSQETAAGLRARGAVPGDRVHLSLGNCPEFLDLWFATALSGTVLVPTSPRPPSRNSRTRWPTPVRPSS